MTLLNTLANPLFSFETIATLTGNIRLQPTGQSAILALWKRGKNVK